MGGVMLAKLKILIPEGLHPNLFFQIDSSSLLSWKSYKQSIIALSSIEAKYIATSTTTKEFIWLQTIITKLGYNSLLLGVLYCNN